MSRAIHLKIKLLTLAAEARLIRSEERRALGAARTADDRASHEQAYRSLHDHRTGSVRRTARTSLLAYAFLRGRDYEQIERRTRTPVDLREVWKAAKRFGSREDLDRWPAWQEAAVAHLVEQAVSVTVEQGVKEVA